MLDDHRVHGNVKFASEVLDDHVQELKNIIPNADVVIESGMDMLQNLKSEITRLDDELSGGVANVNSYFEMLYRILHDREKNIVSGMKSKAKKKEKRLLKRIKALNQAIEGTENSKRTLQHAVADRSKEVGILLEENQLRARVQANLKLVEDEILDCEMHIGGLPNFPVFIPDPSIESKCRSVNFSMDSPARRRSHTLMMSSDAQSRGRANAFTPSEGKSRKLFSRALSGCEVPAEVQSPLIKRAATADPPLKAFTIPDPVCEIGTKALIGRCNHVTAYPYGVCCMRQAEGALLVTDAKHHLFRVITSTGKCLETIGSEGKGDGQFFMPVAITTDEAGNTLVLDGKNPGRVQKFSVSGMYITFKTSYIDTDNCKAFIHYHSVLGKFVSKFKVRSLLSGGSPHVVEPNGLAILMKKRILVTDGSKVCIHEFEESGKYVGKFGNLMNLKFPAGIFTRTYIAMSIPVLFSPLPPSSLT